MAEAIRLSKPKSRAAAYAQEVDLLHHFVELWWANRDIHELVENVKVSDIFSRLRSQARKVVNLWEYAELLRNHLYELNDGHLRLGLTFRRLERHVTSGLAFADVAEGVSLVWADGTYWRDQSTHPEPGDLLIQVDGEPVESYIHSFRLRPGSTSIQRRWNALLSLSWQERLPHEILAPTTILLRSKEGQHYQLPVLWKVTAMNTPGPDCVRSWELHEKIGYLAIRSFYCRDELGQVNDFEFRRQMFESATRVANVEHLIIDLRGNSGGRDEQAQIAASLFTQEPLEWFRYQHFDPYNERQQPTILESAYTDPGQWSPPFIITARLWFLIDAGCFSTCEVFASAFRNRENITFVGQPTSGGAGNPIEFRLPYSGLTVMIPVSKIFMAGSDDTQIEGVGIVPDISVINSAEDIRSGRDRAREVLLSSISKLDLQQ